MRALFWAAAALACAAPAAGAGRAPKVCAECVTANVEHLAAPELRGRACGTADENAAARFIAARLEAYGVRGGAGDGSYLQRVDLPGPTPRTTYNVLGVIPGRARHADRQSIVLSAHYDHVGVRNGVLYPGANDDASGTAAVMEFARILAQGKRPKRTVHIALFGCEEVGGLGAKYWIAHPPAPLENIAANLEFEMIGAPDPQERKALMLTGWERSNLGPALRAHGAHLAPDPYPAQNFFRRSDNYQLALKGVVAQTISAWPLVPTYHQPSDDLAHLDTPFMIEVIQSLVGPIAWLANSEFRPQWNPGKRP